jgi:aspartate aminotransferase-like enzyme
VPDDIVEAMSDPMINHRGPEFLQLFTEITEKLKQVYTLSPGDKVLGVSAGAFGDRFCDAAEAYGADVQRLEFEWGEPIDPQGVRDALRRSPEIKAVLITHNETSTGVTHDLETLSGVVKDEFHKLLLVDAVSSLGCVALPVDGWKCDLVGTASQKGFMIPPGLSFISISKDGWEAQKTATMPRFYFDLAVAQHYLESGQTPWTPNISAMYGLNLALDKMLHEGMENIFDRHISIGQFTRSSILEIGLELLCKDEQRASNTVTAIKIPAGVDGARLVGLMRTEEDVVLAGGQGKLARDIFRIGHLGYFTREDIVEVLEALKRVLPKVGFNAA